jgi:transcriptional regulator NrdR family protein
MAKALNFKCPHCQKSKKHTVENTDPRMYRWNDYLTGKFKSQFGRDLSYRVRTKECGHCATKFRTVELDEEIFRTVMKSYERTEKYDDKYGVFAAHNTKIAAAAVVRAKEALATAESLLSTFLPKPDEQEKDS